MILVSRCLAGDCCRWDGGTNLVPELRALVEAGLAVTVCPEVSGGLSTPRHSSEILDGQVINNAGEDVTECFRKGAEAALRVFEENHCDYAVLKAKSPSCGCGLVHNGKFDGGLVPGNGIAAQLLLDHGYQVVTETAWLKNQASEK
jgi:D-alanine-D-alanine ligase